LVESTGAELIQDYTGTGCVRVEKDGHREVYLVDSPSFRGWLTDLAVGQLKTLPSEHAVKEAMHAIAYRAETGGAKQAVYLRVGGHNGKIYLDLADKARRVVEVGSTGWRILEHSPVDFYRSKGMLALPAPVSGGKVDELFKIFDVGGKSNEMMLIAWMLGALNPSGPVQSW
jgi:hypothetical protein